MPFRFTLLLFIALAMAGCDSRSSTPHFVPDTAKPDWAKEAKEPLPIASAQNYPRYQIVFSPHKAADTFLLDTQKGRIWQLSKFTDVVGQPDAWVDMDIIDSQGEIGMTISDYLKMHPATGAHSGRGEKRPPKDLIPAP